MNNNNNDNNDNNMSNNENLDVVVSDVSYIETINEGVPEVDDVSTSSYAPSTTTEELTEEDIVNDDMNIVVTSRDTSGLGRDLNELPSPQSMARVKEEPDNEPIVISEDSDVEVGSARSGAGSDIEPPFITPRIVKRIRPSDLSGITSEPSTRAPASSTTAWSTSDPSTRTSIRTPSFSTDRDTRLALSGSREVELHQATTAVPEGYEIVPHDPLRCRRLRVKEARAPIPVTRRERQAPRRMAPPLALVSTTTVSTPLRLVIRLAPAPFTMDIFRDRMERSSSIQHTTMDNYCLHLRRFAQFCNCRNEESIQEIMDHGNVKRFIEICCRNMKAPRLLTVTNALLKWVDTFDSLNFELISFIRHWQRVFRRSAKGRAADLSRTPIPFTRDQIIRALHAHADAFHNHRLSFGQSLGYILTYAAIHNPIHRVGAYLGVHFERWTRFINGEDLFIVITEHKTASSHGALMWMPNPNTVAKIMCHLRRWRTGPLEGEKYLFCHPTGGRCNANDVSLSFLHPELKFTLLRKGQAVDIVERDPTLISSWAKYSGTNFATVLHHYIGERGNQRPIESNILDFEKYNYRFTDIFADYTGDDPIDEHTPTT